MAGINHELIKQALSRVKSAFVPSDSVAAAPPGGGGAPPPPQGGPPPGGPPGGGMPGGGAPDPMAGMPPPPAPPAPGGGGGEVDAKVHHAVQAALQAAGVGPGGQGGAGAKPPKPDINTVATDLFQLKKMFLAMVRQQGMELPPDILDGPNRDPVTGAPSASPTGGSDPGAAQAGGAGGGGGAISPISAMQPASMGAPKAAEAMFKAASFEDKQVILIKTAADVLRLYAILREHNAAADDAWNGTLDKVASGEEHIYGTEAPGHPVQRREIDPAAQMAQKAAAISRRFRMKRAACG